MEFLDSLRRTRRLHCDKKTFDSSRDIGPYNTCVASFYNFLHVGYCFHAFLPSVDFFQNELFSK